MKRQKHSPIEHPKPHNNPDTEAAASLHEPAEVVVGSFQRRLSLPKWQLGIAVIAVGSLGIYALVQTFAANPHTVPAPTSTPLAFTQNWQARYADGRGLSGGCFGVDDQASWQGGGTLAPGASYTFTPDNPTCSQSELPVITMHLSWSGSTQVKLETTNQFAPALVAANAYGPYYNNLHEVAPITSDAGGKQQANLCLWADASETVYAEGLVAPATQITTNYHLPWTMTITNTGSQTATISASGYEANGWDMNIYPGCKRADGDGDHWNDSLEMVSQNLTYYSTVADTSPGKTYQGSNYVLAKGTATPNDEVDASPVDFNDDGVVDQTDVDVVSRHLGEGDGVSIDQIGPNQGTPGYLYNETLSWRRYDIDGDGMVTQNDVNWIKGLVGQPLPLTTDPLNPWAVIHTTALHANTSENLYAYAVDNDMLSHVDFYATVSGKQKLLCQVWGQDAPSQVPDTTNDAYSCYFTTPRAIGAPVAITVTAYDNAGHSYTTTKNLVTQ